MDDLDIQIKEHEAKLLELNALKAKRDKTITVNITKFSLSTNRVTLKLSKYRMDLVDYLQYNTDRVYSQENGNIMSIMYLKPFLEKYEKDEYVTILWEAKSKELYDKWIIAPDIYVDLDAREQYAVVQLGPKMVSRGIYLQSYISSFARVEQAYRFSIAELYLFPDAVKASCGDVVPIYSDVIKDILFAQLERRKEIAALANATDAPDIGNPFIEPYNLDPHQRVAVKFTELTSIDNKRAIIAYDMGTGKSAISIALVERHPEWERVLIICPASLKTNWKREIKKFTGKDAFLFSGIEPDSYSMEEWINNKFKYYIINYDIIGRQLGVGDDKVQKWVAMFNLIPPDYISIDEAHYIKNIDSSRSKGVRNLAFTNVTPMSGTPLVNRPKELYPLLSIIDPTSFNSPTAFDHQFTNQDGTARNVKKLHEMMLPYMIRRTRKDVYGDRIFIKRIPFTKELSPPARAIYQQILNGIYQSLRRPDYIRNVTSIFAELIRCKQTCSADNVQASADLAIDAYEETEKKVLIFSQFKESQYALQNILGTSSVVVNGDVVDDDRYDAMDRFQDPGSNVKYWITNILEGLTLTEGHTVIFNDIWWTPKDHSQAEGRCFGRNNDPHGGNSYWLENENTIDQFLNALIMKKTAIFNELIDGVRDSQEEQRSIMSQLIDHLKEGM